MEGKPMKRRGANRGTTRRVSIRIDTETNGTKMQIGKCQLSCQRKKADFVLKIIDYDETLAMTQIMEIQKFDEVFLLVTTTK